MVADHLVRFLERHGQGGGFGLGGGLEPPDGQIIGLDMPGGVLERGQMARGLGAQCCLVHQLFSIGAGGRDQVGVVGGMFGQRLVQLPQRAVQGELAIVGQNLFDLTDVDRGFAQMRGHQIGQRIAE